MARPRNPKRDQAFELWRKSGGIKKLKEIAAELDVSDSQIRKWKNQDQWEQHLNGNVTKQTNGNVTKRGAPNGNRNALGNKGGKAPPSNKNAIGNPGGSAPAGNKNATTTGEYESLMWDFLEDDEKDLFSFIPTDPLFQIDMTIRELTLRQRRMMKRIKTIENGLSEKARKLLYTREMVKEPVKVETFDGKMETHIRKNPQMVNIEIAETEYRKIDDILGIEEALTRVTDKLLKALKQKHEMTNNNVLLPLKAEHTKASIKKLEGEPTSKSGGQPSPDKIVNLTGFTVEELRKLANPNS